MGRESVGETVFIGALTDEELALLAGSTPCAGCS